MTCRLLALDVVEQRTARVPSVLRVAVAARVECPRTVGVEEHRAALLAHLRVDPQQHRSQSRVCFRATATDDMPNAALVFLKHEVHALTNQDVRIHQQETVCQHMIHDVLHRHHVLVASEHTAFHAADVHASIWVLRQFLLEVNHLTPRVVDNCHARHLSREWPRLVPLARLLVDARCRVIEERHLIVLSAVLPKAQYCSLRQLRRVVMNNCYLSVLVHSPYCFVIYLHPSCRRSRWCYTAQ